MVVADKQRPGLQPGPVDAKELRVRKAIRRTLKNYPNIQVSMLGSHIRPYWAPWRNVLEKMVVEGSVIREVRVNQTERGARANFVHRLASLESED